MEGKNCFRTRWTQAPIYSGGNVVSLALKADMEENAEGAQFSECLVMACGDTVNMVCSDTGRLLCGYTLPVEDVILCVDAVSVLGPRDPPSMVDVPVKPAQNRRKKGAPKNANGSTMGPEATTDANGAAAGGLLPELDVPHGSYVAVGTRSLQICLLRIVARHAGEGEGAGLLQAEAHLVHQWTAAQQAISLLSFSVGGQYLLSASTDGGVKVWNAFHHHLTHNLHCPDAGLIQCVYLDPSESLLAIGTFQGHVTVFDFARKELVAHARPHVQAVEAITLAREKDVTYVYTIARDRRLSFLELRPAARELAEKRVVVLKEHVSCALFEGQDVLHVGAEDGQVCTYRLSLTEPVRLVCCTAKRPSTSAGGAGLAPRPAAEEAMARCILVAQQPKGHHAPPLVQQQQQPPSLSDLYVADAGFNIAHLQCSAAGALPLLEYVVASTFVGFLDQILDVKLFPEAAAGGEPRRHTYERVVVNNSTSVCLFDTSGCLSRKVLRGHTDIVMCCAVSSDGCLVATAGKDLEVRFWSTDTWQTVATGVGGHTAEITAVCFNAKQTPSYALLFSIAADENLRLWDVGSKVLPLLGQALPGAMPLVFAHRAGVNAAHAGPVFALAVSPNDQYVATGGKDKVIYLWNVTGKKIYKESALRGHRRGVLAVCFSPADRVLASASNDGCVRLWSLVSLACVKTLQEDRTPVLHLAFFNAGTQMITGNAEGVLRVWAVGSSEVVWSSEAHDEKIWALAVRERQETGETLFYSGAADGVLIATEDYTAEEAERKRQGHRDTLQNEQALANALRRGEFTEAFTLALRLNHPRHLRQVLAQWCAKDLSLCETALKVELLPRLSEQELLQLLQYTREWITNSRHCIVASIVVSVFLGSRHFVDMAGLPFMHRLIEPLLAYTVKHSRRQHDLLTRAYYLDYVTHALTPNTLTTMPPFVSHPKHELENVAPSETDGCCPTAEDAGEPALQRVRV